MAMEFPASGAPVGASLAQYTRRRWGFPTRLIPYNVIFPPANTATRVATNNPRRVEIILVNTASVPCYVGFDGTTTVGKTFFLTGQGGLLSFSADEDGEIVGYEIWVYYPTGSGQMSVLEIEAE